MTTAVEAIESGEPNLEPDSGCAVFGIIEIQKEMPVQK
jgi:hypothetical protein